MKINLDTIAGGYNLAKINENFQKIEDELNDRIYYRDNPAGEPNMLETDMDVNSRRLYNLKAPGNLNEAARLQDVQNAIAGDTAANLITADDGAGGTYWDTVQGFINTIISDVGSAFVGWKNSGVAAVSRFVQEKLRESTSVLDYGADPTGVADSSQAFTDALALHKKVFVPEGSYRLNSTVTVPYASMIHGEGTNSAIVAYGVDAFTIAAGGGHTIFKNLGLFSYTAGGVPDPRLYSAIFCNGTSVNNINYVTCDGLYLQGWIDGINLRYTWNSVVNNVTTVNTNNGVTLTGQSVNNNITKSRLISNGGNASVNIMNDGAFTGEGLTISDTLMASGAYGVKTETGYLSLHITNCIIDLIGLDAINTTDCKELRLSNSWLYANRSCIYMSPLGVAAAQGSSIVGNSLWLNNTVGNVIDVQALNLGVIVSGNHIKHNGTSIGTYIDGQQCVIGNNYYENSGTGVSIYINTSLTTNKIGVNSGVVTIGGGAFATPDYTEGTWTPADVSGAGLVITNVNPAHYIKNGKLVTCSMDIQYPATANASVARISLPFASVVAKAGCAGSIGIQQVVTTQLLPYNSASSANFVFWRPATQDNATNANLSTGRFIITFTYEAST